MRRYKRTNQKELIRLDLEEIIPIVEFFMIFSSRAEDLLKYVEEFKTDYLDEYRFNLQVGLASVLIISENALYRIEQAELLGKLRLIHPSMNRRT